MGLLTDLTPLNMSAEKKKFLRNPASNPIFSYTRLFQTTELVAWGLPKESVAQYCLAQLKQHSLQEPGDYIDQTFIKKALFQFNADYHLLHPIEVKFSETFATKVKVSSDFIYFKLPIRYTTQTFSGLYRHELETHILRRVNHLENFGETEMNSELEFRRTEEGLANLHSHLFRENKEIRKTFLSYYSAYLAQQHSFSAMFAALLTLGMTEERAWNLCLRNKRGVIDTSATGGFTKDICYLEGTIRVWDWLVNQGHNPHDLYLGRLNLETAEALARNGQKYKVITPTFMSNQEMYLDNITEIGKVNQFAELQGII